MTAFNPDVEYVDRETELQLLTRIAIALETLTGIIDEHLGGPPKAIQADTLPPDQLAPLPLAGQYVAPNPPQAYPMTPPAHLWVCPLHGQVKTVPAGVSKKTGQPYSAFLACPVQGCTQKPPRV